MTDPRYKGIGSPVDRMVEEIGELLQAIGKGERFGWDNHHPDREKTNAEEFMDEWDDLQEAYAGMRAHIHAFLTRPPREGEENTP